MNAYLKEIADICEITKPLTYHIARHTFATTITLTNNVPIETVSKMLGHKSIRTTQIYSKVVDAKISNDMKSLKDKLSHYSFKKRLLQLTEVMNIMGIKDYPFQLYSEPQANLVKLDINLSYEFFEELRIIAESYWYKANPYHQPLKHCMKYDVMDFLKEIFQFEKDEAYTMVSNNSRSILKDKDPNLSPSVYIHTADIGQIKRALGKCGVSFLPEYFSHEFCFLIAYYCWLIPNEKQHDYTEFIHGFFPIQPYEDNYIKDELEKHIRDLLNDEEIIPALCSFLGKDIETIRGYKKMELSSILITYYQEKGESASPKLNTYINSIESVWNYQLKREPLYKDIKKILNNKDVHPIFKEHIEKWDYWNALKKKMNIYYTIKKELKTTNKKG